MHSIFSPSRVLRLVNYEFPQLSRSTLIALVIGICLGFSITILFTTATTKHLQWHLCSSRPTRSQFRETLADHNISVSAQDVIQRGRALVNSTIAEKLEMEIRVLCWIMTSPENHKLRARHILRTWGKRCNKLLFISSTFDEELGSIALNVTEGRDHLWEKTKLAFTYIYNNHFNDYDWFVKADDDTYMILENLRFMLYRYSPSDPLYFGCKFKPYVKQGYMSGGAGYVLSKEAVRRFVVNGIPNAKLCRQDGNGSEDLELGICLENVQVLAGDSRDTEGRSRFLPFPPADHLIPDHIDKSNWYWEYIYYETNVGRDCCSDDAISFHYVSPDEMYVMDYLIYFLRPQGITFITQDLPPKITFEQIKAESRESDKLNKL